MASPPFAYLDEALSAICRETRLQLYAALKDTKITYVSTSGDLELLPFHDQVLEFLADGQWSFHPVDRWDPKK